MTSSTAAAGEGCDRSVGGCRRVREGVGVWGGGGRTSRTCLGLGARAAEHYGMR